MTQSIATLGIAVTTKGVQEAERDLGKLEKTGAKVEQQAGKTAKAMQSTAMSAKQLQAATRGLPAQFTDIATSLGSGQRPLQVLLQQGGQLKDMFGGIGPAFRAMGGYVAGMINPLTVATGVLVGLGAAWVAAEERSAAFNKALILTGNYAASSADELENLAAQLDKSTSATAGQASAALAQVAASGRFTAEQLELVTKAALQMEDATGQALEDTIKQFVALKGDPVEAVLKLNDTMHFLTRETLDQIEAFKDQGREADAAALAMQAYADAINTRTPQVTANLGLFASLWRELKNAIREAGDEAVNSIGSMQGQLNGLLQSRVALASLTAISPFVPGVSSLITASGKSGKNNAGSLASAGVDAGFNFARNQVDSSVERARRKAQEEFDRLALSNLSKKQKLETEIAQIRALGTKAGRTDVEIEKQIAAARARYAESLPKGRKPPKGPSDSSIQNARDRFNDMVGNLQAELEGPLERVEQQHIKRMRELDQAAKAGKVSHDDLAQALVIEGYAYKSASEEVQRRYDLEIAALSGPMAQEQEMHAQNVRRIDQLTKETTVTTAEYARMLEEEAKRHAEAAREIERQLDPLGQLVDSMQFELDMLGKSNAERAIMNELRRAGIDIMSAEAQAVLNTGRAFEQEAEAKQRSIDLMDDFREGASNALADFVTGAKSAKDALKDFFDEMAAQIAKAISDKWMQQLFGQQGTTQTGSAGGGIWDMLGSLFGMALGSGGGGASAGAGSTGYLSWMQGGYAKGGYTGDGPSNEVAGVVHRGEYVIPADQVKRMRQGGGGGGNTVVVNYSLQGRMSRQVESQIAQHTLSAANRSLARNR